MNEISWGRKTKDSKRQQKLKRRVLLDTAAHEFTTKGYSETSINDLADLLDVSPRTTIRDWTYARARLAELLHD